MESHHDGDETKGSVHLFVQDYIEARKASTSLSVRTAGPKDRTPDGTGACCRTPDGTGACRLRLAGLNFGISKYAGGST
jgi:hypothetical protein